MRNVKIDLLRTIAIVAVVLYHMGFQTYGYLGVDIFFVISGFFLMKSFEKVRDSRFGFFKVLTLRLSRLWPVVVIASAVCLIVGVVAMLPDDLENLGESVIASNLFMTNILSMITTKDYWAITNNYRPLMHTWYLGVLIQSFVVCLVFFKAISNYSRKKRIFACATLTIISLALYLMPFSKPISFYFFFFRLFEILAGSLLMMIGTGNPWWGGGRKKKCR